MDNFLFKYDCVFINELKIMMSLGIYEFEKVKPQEVLISIDLYVQKSDGKIPENIQDVVSYEIVAEQIRTFCGSRHFDLAEELGEIISEICLNHTGVKHACVKIEKTQIIKDTKSVGVKIIRSA